MASESVRITNMPESGSAERVAFELLEKIMYHEEMSGSPRKHILDLYAECVSAAHGHRKIQAQGC